MSRPMAQALLRALLVMALTFNSYGLGRRAVDGMSGFDWVVAGSVAALALGTAGIAASDRLAVKS